MMRIPPGSWQVREPPLWTEDRIIALLSSYGLLKRPEALTVCLRAFPTMQSTPSSAFNPPTSHPADIFVNGVVHCFHGEPASQFTSRTAKNPNRYLVSTLSFVTCLIMLLGFSINVQHSITEVNPANSGVRPEILCDEGQRHSNYSFSMGRLHT